MPKLTKLSRKRKHKRKSPTKIRQQQNLLTKRRPKQLLKPIRLQLRKKKLKRKLPRRLLKKLMRMTKLLQKKQIRTSRSQLKRLMMRKQLNLM